LITLRPYQKHAVNAIYNHLRERDDNPCVVIPTGGGKTPVLATVCKDAVVRWKGRVLILAHVKELLEQAVDKLNIICPEVNVGIYSAGLKRRDTDSAALVAGIQSVYKIADSLGAFDLIVVDEAHMIPIERDGMYRQFLSDSKTINPNVRVIGLTATPYRMKTGMICEPDNILNHVSYEVGVRQLIDQGYLSNLISKGSQFNVDTSKLHVRGGEFIASETESLMDRKKLVSEACSEIIHHTRDRKSCLIFSSGVKHGEHIVNILRNKHDVNAEAVFGDSLIAFRDRTLCDFKEGRLKYLVNVNVLTTGFDAPNIDCIALVRPTLSPGLYYQMVGRGFRIQPDKENCLVLDFGGNVLRHGPVDAIQVRKSKHNGKNDDAPAKECLRCQTIVAPGCSVCPDCGYEFPESNRSQHDAKAADAPILSDQTTSTKYEVQDVKYYIHTKSGAGSDNPQSMRVEYKVGWHQYHKEWICFEHEGYARRKAELWWKKRSYAPIPDCSENAVNLAEDGALASTDSITVKCTGGDDFDRIVKYETGEKPDWREPGWDEDEDITIDDLECAWIGDEEVPF